MGRKKFEKRTIPKPNDKPELSSSDDDDLEQLAQQVVKQTQSPAVSDNEVLAFSSDEESINDFGDIDNWNEDQGRNTFHIRRTGEFDRAPAIDDESGFKELEENEAVVRRQRMIEAIDKEADDDLINQLREMAIPSQQIAEPTQTHVELDALADEIDGKRNMLEKVLGPFLKLVAEDNDLGDEMKKFVDNCRQLYSFYAYYISLVHFYFYLKLADPDGFKAHPIVKDVILMRKSMDRSQSDADFLMACIDKFRRGELEFEMGKDEAVEFEDDCEVAEVEHSFDKEEGDNRREVGFDILKNKGIVPKRKKEMRNPRVRHRKRYARAQSKRKAQVPDIRNRDKPYEGESTGIRTRLKRSIRLE